MSYSKTDQDQKKPSLVGSKVQAGFPSPAENYEEHPLDFNKHLIENKAATFVVEVSGDSMIDEGIEEGDLLIVDRSKEAVSGKIVIASLDGDLTVKKLKGKAGSYILASGNPNYEDIKVERSIEAILWGVVTFVIKKV